MSVAGEDHANSGDTLSFPAGSGAGWGLTDSPFERPEWYHRLARMHFGNRRAFLASGAVEGTTATLPLVAGRSETAEALANWYSFAVRPLVAPKDADTDTANRALDALFAALRTRLARVTLTPVPEWDGTLERLTRAARAAGWRVRTAITSQHHWLDLSDARAEADPFAHYWASRPGKLRSTVQRKGKKGAVTLAVQTAVTDDAWQAYETVYANSWKPAEGNPALLANFARSESAAARARLGIAWIDNAPVAAQFWTVEGGTAYIHKLAHIHGVEAQSPGTLLSHALFQHVIATDGVSRVDFGTGDDAYKRDWMNRCDPLWRVDFYNPARPGAWFAMARSTLAAARTRMQQ